MNDEPSRKAEPVAWMREDGVIAFHSQKEVDSQGFKWIPLYTHPAKCSKCNDTEWVCENHPDQEAHKCSHCEGAGKPCECTHPAKELHLSLQKSKETGELLAVTYTDDEHRIVEVLWKKPPAKTLTDEEIGDFTHRMVLCCQVHPSSADINVLGLKFIVEDILRKAQEK